MIEDLISQNDCYASPMYPFTIIVPRLLDLVDWSINLKKPMKTESSVEQKDSFQRTRRPSLHNFKSFASAAGSHSSDIHRHDSVGEKKSKHISHIPSMLSKTFSSIRSAMNLKRGVSVVHPGKEDKVEPVNVEQQVVDSIKEALLKIGENPIDTLPLLNNVLLPDIDILNATEHLRPAAKTNLLGDLLIRMINKLTEHRPIAFLVDDVQW